MNWINVKDRLPEPHSEVFVTGICRGKRYYDIVRYKDPLAGWDWTSFDPVADDWIHETGEPTHWQEIAPPRDGSSEGETR
jgi:hypothetical protein